MASKKKFVIDTPRGAIYTSKNKNGVTTAKLEWKQGWGQEKGKKFESAQEFVDSECIRRMNPLSPRLTGVLIKSATLGTVIGSGLIEYAAPYARRQYYEHKTKKKWFETMKKAHGESIRKGVARFVK